MAGAVEPTKTWSMFLIVAPLVLNGLVLFAIWMWKRSLDAVRNDSTLQDHLYGGPSVKTQLDELTSNSQRQDAEIKRLHKVASDMNSALIVKVGNIDVTLQQRLQLLSERDVRELRGRVDRIEQGQTEWLKTLRHRTHQLGNMINHILLRITLIERGVKPATAPDSGTFQFERDGLDDES